MSASRPREFTFSHKDERIEPGQMIFGNTMAADNGPIYSPSEAAKIFGISPQWLRKMESQGILKTERKKGQWRRYSLKDIEDMSYDMADHGLIDYTKHKAVLNVILNLARIWKIA